MGEREEKGGERVYRFILVSKTTKKRPLAFHEVRADRPPRPSARKAADWRERHVQVFGF